VLCLRGVDVRALTDLHVHVYAYVDLCEKMCQGTSEIQKIRPALLSLRGGGGDTTLADFRKKLPSELLEEYDLLHKDDGGAAHTAAAAAPSKRTWWPSAWYPTKDEPVGGSVKVSFEYMTEFIIDTFRAYGVPLSMAELAADVLIEADKRGISSHGIGRLKPIYCDRMDDAILSGDAPMTIEKDNGATALVNGNLGLGVY
jgi:hypothetical protein